MRFGLQIATYPSTGIDNSWDRMLAVAQLAEELGFDSVWYEDHFMFRDDEQPSASSPQLECLVTLAALAASTVRVKLGMLVLGAPYRNPALLTKMLTTLDLVSHGRLIIGLGAGWHEQEFRAYGWPFLSVRERMEQLTDTIQIINALMTTRSASYQGKHFSIDRALNDPPPVQRPRPPLLIGGNGEQRTLRLVAQYADMCNVYGSVAECQHKFEVLRQHCAAVGRPYDHITRTINHWALLADTEAERASKKAQFPQAFSIDTIQETIQTLQEFAAVGTQYVIVKILDAGDLTPVRQFAETILPAFTDKEATPHQE